MAQLLLPNSNHLMKYVLTLLLLSGYAHAQANNADSATYYQQKAQEYKKIRKIWDAEKSYLKAIQFNPQNDKIRLELADYYLEFRKYFQALEQYNAILQSNPNHAIANQKQLELSFQLRRWQDVIAQGSRLAKAAHIANLDYILGKAYYETDNYGMAQTHLQKAISKTPVNTDAVLLMGKVYIELSNYRMAMDLYKKAVESDPENFNLIAELAQLHYVMKQDKEAVKLYEIAAQKGLKQDLEYWENLGMCYLSYDIPKGIEVLNKVLVMKPNEPEIMTQIAQALMKAEKFQEAYEYYNNIYKADPNNSRALYMSGVAIIRKGDKKTGAAICEKAIAMDPELAKLRSTSSVF
jgi:tetratricopeptide (TPR) repeat protein